MALILRELNETEAAIEWTGRILELNENLRLDPMKQLDDDRRTQFENELKNVERP
jgi:hypothetical protein